MKKILILLCFVFLCLTTFSQAGNDTLKYTYYKFNYGEKFNRIWGLNVVDLPNDTTYSKYGIARKHDSVYVGNGVRWKFISSIGGTNIGNSDLILTANRHLSGSYTHSLNFDSLTGFDMGINGGVATIHSFDNLTNLQVEGNRIYNTVFGASNTNYYEMTGDSVFLRSADISNSTLFSLTPTKARLKGLVQANDSTAYKAIGVGTDGILKRMDGWPGGGGGGSSTASIQTITSGTSGTVTGSNYWVRFNPASALATYTLTLPASPTVGQSVTVIFGGTIIAGPVVTAFTVAPNTSQSIIDNTPPAGGSVTADNTFQYLYVATNLWIRKKL